MNPQRSKLDDWKREIEIVARRITRWSHDHVPPGIRSILGVLFFIGGIFGFLPILGFWMIPVGVMLIMLDLPFLRHRVVDWMRRDDDPGRGDTADSETVDSENDPTKR